LIDKIETYNCTFGSVGLDKEGHMTGIIGSVGFEKEKHVAMLLALFDWI
jgi:hypothetical protein